MNKCLICGAYCKEIGSVDFNKNCVEKWGVYLPSSGIDVVYVQCVNCMFAYAPMFQDWSRDDFKERIYNADYVIVDPEYSDIRPRQLAGEIMRRRNNIAPYKHADYGGGSGLMSVLLRREGWDSTCVDPFSGHPMTYGLEGGCDLVTCFEVMEHVARPMEALEAMKKLLCSKGRVTFTTTVSNGLLDASHPPASWWYCSPRNGHISMFSNRSLEELGKQFGFKTEHHGNGWHSYI